MMYVPIIPHGLYAAGRLQAPVFVVRCPYTPPVRLLVVFYLECLPVRDLVVILVGTDIHACNVQQENLILILIRISTCIYVIWLNFRTWDVSIFSDTLYIKQRV